MKTLSIPFYHSFPYLAPMSETEQDYAGTVYACPVCGGDAKISFEDGTSIVCPKCGATRIILSFSPNGDMITVSENNNEYYEVEPSVRKALARLKDAEGLPEEERDLAIIDADVELINAYNATAREGRAENLANDTLAELAAMVDAGKDVGDRYCDQVSMCAAFASARSDYDKAQKIYDEALEKLKDVRNVDVATLKVKRGLLWTKRDSESAERHLRDALDIVGDSDTSSYPDPYIRVIAYDALRAICAKRMDNDAAEKFLLKSIDERKALLKNDPDTPSYRTVELVDVLGYYAETLSKYGDDNLAEEYLDEALAISEQAGHEDAHAYAVMNRLKYEQNRRLPLPEDIIDRMDSIIRILEAQPAKDKRLKETLAQAYMFKSMGRKPEDYDGLTEDIGSAYNILLDLAYQGDVNEMYLMSVARSYLILLNMKYPEKAKEIRRELQEIGISQKTLDESSRSSIGNSGKKTKVDLDKKQPEKPLPGRRLKRQVKKKE